MLTKRLSHCQLQLYILTPITLVTIFYSASKMFYEPAINH